MKKLISLMLVLLLLILFAFTALAHPGRTDSNGGHYNRSTGEYHYHHGYSAHQHPNGECPYDFDDKTGSNSGYYLKPDTTTSSKSSSYKTTSSIIFSDDTDKEKIEDLEKELKKYKTQRSNSYSVIVFLVIVIFFAFAMYSEERKEKNKILKESNHLNDDFNIVTKKYNSMESEYKNLQIKYKTKCTSLENLEIKIQNFKRSLDEIEIRHLEDKKNYEYERSEILKQTEIFIAENFGILPLSMLPDETIPQYIDRILNDAALSGDHPFVFTTSLAATSEENKKLNADFAEAINFANTIRRKYEIKGYTVTLFKSENTLEKYLFAYNKTNLLLIQCVYLADEQVCTAEHILALQASLSKFQQKNNRNNVKALIITNTTLSEDAKALADELHFYYRENK